MRFVVNVLLVVCMRFASLPVVGADYDVVFPYLSIGLKNATATVWNSFQARVVTAQDSTTTYTVFCDDMKSCTGNSMKQLVLGPNTLELESSYNTTASLSEDCTFTGVPATAATCIGTHVGTQTLQGGSVQPFSYSDTVIAPYTTRGNEQFNVMSATLRVVNGEATGTATGAVTSTTTVVGTSGADGVARGRVSRWGVCGGLGVFGVLGGGAW
ncbi:hypothetical protein K458DRAFT_487460 [Lentithecium fluviatile CBS 122367]|uniref:Uncharacterized protein n=1 Tax=Lentithecium fluviatile CBS 122367 TaxID=1168545 RepID=A0A6G1J297_9PLEO|nr:hypothetical protein K458DRAFT_487460 [Lentithecium fluviatile CBS 122367]